MPVETKKTIKRVTPPSKPKPKDPRSAPLGKGLADRAKQNIVNRKKMLDEL